MKLSKSLQKAKAQVEPERASTMELFYVYIKRLTIFAIKAPS